MGGKKSNKIHAGIKICLGEQDGEFLRARVKDEGVDWFVYTSALPPDHPEIQMAKKLKLRISKRDELISYLIKKLKPAATSSPCRTCWLWRSNWRKASR